MVRRYVVACALIMAVSLGSAALAHAGTSSTTYVTNCTFQVFIHLSRNPPISPDNQRVIASLALQQVTTAYASGLIGQIARREKVSPVYRVRPTAGLGTFLVTVQDPDPKRAVRVANAICDLSTQAIKKQRAAEIAAQVKGVQDRILAIQTELKRLEKIPSKKRTLADNAALQGQRSAIVFNSTLIANIISLPPDEIIVLSRAANTGRKQTGSLSKNVIIAIVGGLLASFLYILVGEVVAERRRTQAATATVPS